MSTKQSVIFTFMILFLAAMLFGMGAWFHYSTELDLKEKMIESLKDQLTAAKIERDGTSSRKGVKAEVDDVSDGLAKKLTDESAKLLKTEGAEGSTDSETTRGRQVLYEQKESELKTKWPAASGKWKVLYEEWLKQNAEIEEAVKKLKSQSAENTTKTAQAQTELDSELNTETVEKKKMVDERKKNQDDLGSLRASHEGVLEKITDVARDTKKVSAIVPQGKVIHADESVKLVTIDKGMYDGVKRGMRFDVYSGSHSGLVKKAIIEITNVKASSSDCAIYVPSGIDVVDPQTGWTPTDKRMRYSIFSASGQDETNAQELIKPKTREDRIAAYRMEKIEREQGAAKVEELRHQVTAPTTPPVELGKGFVPLIAGDWINNPEFVPIVPDVAYQKKAVEELLSMQDINLSGLTFHITDSVRPYRKEFLKRLCERNRCRTSDTMSNDVNLVITASGATRADLVTQKLESSKGKEEVSGEIKNLRKTLDALTEGKKIGAQVMAEDEVEQYFLQRQRKNELLRGNTIQPGRSTFFVAGETKERSVAQTRSYIKDHGGVPMQELDEKVDYVVVGAGLNQEFYDKVKRMGLKIIREDELPHFFGLE
jgi:hypothetical protein